MPSNTLSLKQRLAALSLSPSSPTSPHGFNISTSSSGGGKRRTFNPPWGRRSTGAVVDEQQDAQDRLEDVMSKMIFQAGVDFELVAAQLGDMMLLTSWGSRTRPMCVHIHT